MGPPPADGVVVDADRVEHECETRFTRPPPAPSPDCERLGDNVGDLAPRVEGGDRVLEDHLQLRPGPAQLLARQGVRSVPSKTTSPTSAGRARGWPGRWSTCRSRTRRRGRASRPGRRRSSRRRRRGRCGCPGGNSTTQVSTRKIDVEAAPMAGPRDPARGGSRLRRSAGRPPPAAVSSVRRPPAPQRVPAGEEVVGAVGGASGGSLGGSSSLGVAAAGGEPAARRGSSEVGGAPLDGVQPGVAGVVEAGAEPSRASV